MLNEALKAAGLSYNQAGQIVAASGAVIAQAGADAQRVVDMCEAKAREGGEAAASFAQELVKAGSPYAKVAMTEAMRAAGCAYDEAGLLVNSSGKYINQAMEVISLAAAQGLQAARVGAATLSPYMADASSALMSGGRELAANAAPMAGAAARAVMEGAAEAKDAAADAYATGREAATDFYNSPLVKAGTAATFAAASDAYAMSREELTAAMAAVGGLATAVFDFVKFDIFRDFFQTLGLFFATMASEAMAAAKTIWGNLSGLINIDWGYVFNLNSDVIIYVLIGVAAILILGAFFWMKCVALKYNPDEIRDGHEVTTWDQQAEERKKTVKAIKLILTASLSAYLPVSRVVFQIMFCNSSIIMTLNSLIKGAAIQDGKCWDSDIYLYFFIFAIFLLFSYTLTLPFFCYRIIRDSRPVGSVKDPNMRYDEDGIAQPYTDAMYNEDVLKNPKYAKSPFQFMFKGYERKWSYYKVIVMVFKFLLVLPVIVLAGNVVGQGIVTIAILAAFGAYSKYTSPFISRTADHMDFAGRVAALVTVVCGVVGSADIVGTPVPGIFGIIINITQGLNFVFMALMILIALPAVKKFVKNFTGRLTFSDTCADTEGPVDSILPGWLTKDEASGRYVNLDRECKHRIWHPFWDSVIINAGEEFAKRLQKLQEITQNNGRRAIVTHFNALQVPGVREWRVWVQANLEGVDVYWDGIPADGELNSKTKFGKMYVEPYPFQCVIIYDDDTDYGFVEEKDFAKFVQLNQREDIVQRRQRRVMLRALSGQKVHLEHVQMETHTVPDGMEEYKDSEGNTQTRQRMTAVSVEMHYSDGVLSVKSNKEHVAWAAGFHASIHYTDGRGEAIAPHTGQRHVVSGSTTIGHDAMGIDDNFSDTGRLRELFMHPANQPLWQAGVPVWHQKCKEYRDSLMEKRHKDEQVLNSGFWLNVYDHYAKPRAQLIQYLTTYEANPKIKNLPAEVSEGLEYLYSRIKYVTTHPCAALWFVFFDDVWEQNKDMKAFAGKEALFDPKEPKALCYRPMRRKACEKILEEEGLLHDSKLFSKTVMDTFFGAMDELNLAMQQRQRGGGGGGAAAGGAGNRI